MKFAILQCSLFLNFYVSSIFVSEGTKSAYLGVWAYLPGSYVRDLGGIPTFQRFVYAVADLGAET